MTNISVIGGCNKWNISTILKHVVLAILCVVIPALFSVIIESRAAWSQKLLIRHNTYSGKLPQRKKLSDATKRGDYICEFVMCVMDKEITWHGSRGLKSDPKRSCCQRPPQKPTCLFLPFLFRVKKKKKKPIRYVVLEKIFF